MAFNRAAIQAALNEAFKETESLGSVNLNEANEINEAEMDKRFMKDWEKSCTALINHLNHELKKPENKKDHYKELNNLINMVKHASDVPNKLAAIVGTN